MNNTDPFPDIQVGAILLLMFKHSDYKHILIVTSVENRTIATISRKVIRGAFKTITGPRMTDNGNEPWFELGNTYIDKINIWQFEIIA